MFFVLLSVIWLWVLDVVDVCVIIVDVRVFGCFFFYVNMVFCEMIGYSLDEVIGYNCSFL